MLEQMTRRVRELAVKALISFPSDCFKHYGDLAVSTSPLVVLPSLGFRVQCGVQRLRLHLSLAILLVEQSRD